MVSCLPAGAPPCYKAIFIVMRRCTSPDVNAPHTSTRKSGRDLRRARWTRVRDVDASTNVTLELAAYLGGEGIEKVTLEPTSRSQPWRRGTRRSSRCQRCAYPSLPVPGERSSRLSTFPLALRGNASTTITDRGTLKFASRSRHQAMMCSATGAAPGFGMT